MDDALLSLLDSLKPARFLVLGDVMLDRTHQVRLCGIDSETSITVAESLSTTNRPGGAAFVAELLSRLGNDVIAAGIIGIDAEARILSEKLESSGIWIHLIADGARPTTLKERFYVSDDRCPRWLPRIDRESTSAIPACLEAELGDFLVSSMNECDGVVISDYAKGVCSTRLVASLIESARRSGLPVVVDPARRGSFARYSGCDVITPNRREAESASGISIRSVEEASQAGRLLCAQANAGACVITLDADGAVWTSRGEETHAISAMKRRVVDPTGAGDAFAASLLHALVSGLGPQRSIQWANFVAGLQVEQLGTAPITLHDAKLAIHKDSVKDTTGKCVTLADLERAITHHRASGKRIVLSNGCFDLLHAGHVGYLEQAAAEGDYLVVAVNADQSVARLKGPSRPIYSHRERARLLAALACVDYVIVFDEPTPHEIIRRIRPDVLAKGGDYAAADVVGREVVEAYGGQVKTLGLTPGTSTTQILRRLATAPADTLRAG